MINVSVILACYNAEKTLSQALDSILAQNYREFEVIIVDGCSTDNTAGIIRSHKSEKIRHIVEKDDGIYDAFNKGVELANGTYVYFMGADDMLYDESVLQDIFVSDAISEQYDLIIGDIMFDNERVRKSDVSGRTCYRNTVHHQSAFYRKELFRTFRYNTSFQVSADYELNLLLFLQGAPVLKVDKIVSKVGLGGISNRVDFCGYVEEIEIRNKYLKRSPARMVMNSFTYLRYLAKKTGKLLGRDFHFYN